MIGRLESSCSPRIRRRVAGRLNKPHGGSGEFWPIGPGINTVRESVCTQWLATFRDVWVFAADRVLFSRTAGGAVGQVNCFDLLTYLVIASQGGTSSNTNFGWTAGTGIEWATNGPYGASISTLTSEAGFTLINTTPGFTTDAIVHNHHFTTNLARASLNYRWGGTVVAKY
jgi:outer membrane immunogenic protein